MINLLWAKENLRLTLRVAQREDYLELKNAPCIWSNMHENNPTPSFCKIAQILGFGRWISDKWSYIHSLRQVQSLRVAISNQEEFQLTIARSGIAL